MFLTASNLVHYLLARGLVGADTVVDGDFRVAEVGRRNRNYKVILKNGNGLFVKQIKNFDAMAISTLQREAACYRIARQNAAYSDLAASMTRLIDHDANRHCLIVELISGGENLNEYFVRSKNFPAEIGKMLGTSLGGIHQTLRGKPLQTEEMAAFPRLPPWILSYHNNNAFPAGSLSGGTLKLAEIVRQYPDLHYNLDRLRQHWRYDSLIHGDMKWDNCMVYPAGDGGLQLKIIDWELLDYGDACWDVGGIFQAFLTSWIYSMPIGNETSPQRLIDNAGLQLEALHPAIRAFWRSYLETGGIPRQYAAHYLIRSIEYSAARLVQTAFESLFVSPVMTGHAATLLQVSLNILRNPHEAALALYGLGEEGAR
ncbi:MAG: phosphotransferase [Sideroxydans sp.]|nr:phosphotransferase [Sideroxydans sp.]